MDLSRGSFRSVGSGYGSFDGDHYPPRSPAGVDRIYCVVILQEDLVDEIQNSWGREDSVENANGETIGALKIDTKALRSGPALLKYVIPKLLDHKWLEINMACCGHGVGANPDFLHNYLDVWEKKLTSIAGAVAVSGEYALISAVEPASLADGYHNLDAVGAAASGRVRPGEEPWDAARRLTLEEMGILLPSEFPPGSKFEFDCLSTIQNVYKGKENIRFYTVFLKNAALSPRMFINADNVAAHLDHSNDIQLYPERRGNNLFNKSYRAVYLLRARSQKEKRFTDVPKKEQELPNEVTNLETLEFHPDPSDEHAQSERKSEVSKKKFYKKKKSNSPKEAAECVTYSLQPDENHELPAQPPNASKKSQRTMNYRRGKQTPTTPKGANQDQESPSSLLNSFSPDLESKDVQLGQQELELSANTKKKKYNKKKEKSQSDEKSPENVLAQISSVPGGAATEEQFLSHISNQEKDEKAPQQWIRKIKPALKKS